MVKLKKINKFAILLIILSLLVGIISGCGNYQNEVTGDEQSVQSEIIDLSGSESDVVSENTDKSIIDEDGEYSSKEEVAEYIHTYNKLPSNYITKKAAQSLGWEGGSLEPYAPGKCIGGDTFGNYEGILPKKSGRQYHECDIDTMGAKSRGAKRIVYSNDGLIYYTEDHYETFELIYGDESDD